MVKTDIDKVYRILKTEFPKWHVPVIELIESQTKDPFRVLLATILSARTKDDVTSKAAKRLFKKVKNPSDLDSLSIKQIEKLIYPVGFYKTKAKHLKRLPEVLEEEFDGVLPDSVDELTRLPGVGRKTANLVVAVGFHKPAICVDIHVFRISNRLGYVRTKTPLETEMLLRKILPKKYWQTYNTYLVAFGQRICTPVSPKCSECLIRDYCARIGVTKSR